METNPAQCPLSSTVQCGRSVNKPNPVPPQQYCTVWEEWKQTRTVPPQQYCTVWEEWKQTRPSALAALEGKGFMLISFFKL